MNVSDEYFYNYDEACLQDSSINGKIEWKVFTCSGEVEERESSHIICKSRGNLEL